MHLPKAVKSGIVNLVRGEARQLLEFIGFESDLSILIESLEDRFDPTSNTFKLQQDFFY